MPIKLGVLLSGSGTNLQAIIDAIDAGKLDATIELVVSSRPDAYGLKRAEAAGLQTLTLSKETYEDPFVADMVIATELKRYNVDYVVMAGYMRKVGVPILNTFLIVYSICIRRCCQASAARMLFRMRMSTVSR